MGRPRLLCIGYYGKDNIGDDVFADVIPTLWPDIDFFFADKIPADVNNYDGVWFGPGDIFESPIPGLQFHEITVPVGLVGVGIGHYHSAWLKTIQNAKLIVTRDQRALMHLPKATLMPDLAFAAGTPAFTANTDSKEVVVFLNENQVPDYTEPNWRHQCWDWFKHEFSQVCDDLVFSGRTVRFVPMQISPWIDDRVPAAEIIGKMKDRGTNVIWEAGNTITAGKAQYLIAHAELVIAARLHAMVFSTQLGVPFVGFEIHDKMQQYMDFIGWDHRAQFYGVRKNELIQIVDNARVASTQHLLDYSTWAYEQWQNFAGTMADKFFS